MPPSSTQAESIGRKPGASLPVFLIFLRLGLTSFGGPVAHLGYFREELVVRRRWLSEAAYADLVALCQFLPGPASSQVGMALGLYRCGYAGALAAWLGFTLPSALALIALALGLAGSADSLPHGLLQGLKVVAVAVVAQAVWGMARQLCPGLGRKLLMLGVAVLLLFLPSLWTQLGTILLAALLGQRYLMPGSTPLSPHPIQADQDGLSPPPTLCISRAGASRWLLLFLVLLLGLPLLHLSLGYQSLALVDAFFRAGALVFGGGHVVLPLLQAEVVPTGWVSHETFLAGYGATQAVPGPLFTFAAFLGAAMNQAPTGWLGGGLALLAIFAPAFLLLAGALPFWEQLRHQPRARGALAGVNCAVVGLLLAALYNPVWTSAIHSASDLLLALAALAALTWARLPPWLVVTACALAGVLLHA